MLQLAWFNNDINLELQCYKNLSIDYYYLGILDKSEYYNKRVVRGMTENGNSVIKKVAMQILKTKLEQKMNVNPQDEGKKNGKDI